MALEFRKASCVVVGTFNMYILHPQWLTDHGIIEKGTEVGIQTNFTRPGFRFHLQQYGSVWVVAPDRVVIESEDPQTNCGDIVARILKALPETPLIAIGNNAVFQGGIEERDTLNAAVRDFPQMQSPNDGETVTQRTFHVAVNRDEHETTNVQLSIKEEAIELSCNVHVKLDGRTDANMAAVTAAEHFFENRDTSKTLARHFFGGTTENGTDNA